MVVWLKPCKSRSLPGALSQYPRSTGVGVFYWSNLRKFIAPADLLRRHFNIYCDTLSAYRRSSEVGMFRICASFFAMVMAASAAADSPPKPEVELNAVGE